MGLLLKGLVLVALAYFIHHSIKVIYITGIFVYRHNHQPGPCRIIPGIEFGSEDVQTLPNGIALITAGMNAGKTSTPHKFRGIYTFDFNQPDKNLTKLTLTGDLDEKDFVPHGFHVWTDEKTGTVTVFAVNHGRTYWDNESVEVFKYDEKNQSLHHLRTIRDKNFQRLNDIVATSSDTFYATNDDVWFQGLWKWKVEPFLQTRFGNVVFYDGKSARPVASGYVLANGINITPDQRTVYLISYGEAQMIVFQRHSDNSLKEIKRVDLHMPRPDNIELDFNGDLWIAGGYKLLADDKKKPPSSMVIRGKEDNGDFKFTEVYVNDGMILDSASVVSFYNDKMLIGTPRQRLLYCDVKVF